MSIVKMIRFYLLCTNVNSALTAGKYKNKK